MASAPTGEVTLVFTDMEGSSARWERDAERLAMWPWKLIVIRFCDTMPTSGDGADIRQCGAALPSPARAGSELLRCARRLVTSGTLS